MGEGNHEYEHIEEKVADCPVVSFRFVYSRK